jgi:hypothetical protein
MSKQKPIINNMSRKLKLKSKNSSDEEEDDIDSSLYDKYNDESSYLIEENKIESEIKNTKEDLNYLKQTLNYKLDDSPVNKSINSKKENEIKKKVEDYLNLNNEKEGNELPMVRYTSTNYNTDETYNN